MTIREYEILEEMNERFDGLEIILRRINIEIIKLKKIMDKKDKTKKLSQHGC